MKRSSQLKCKVRHATLVQVQLVGPQLEFSFSKRKFLIKCGKIKSKTKHQARHRTLSVVMVELNYDLVAVGKSSVRLCPTLRFTADPPRLACSFYGYCYYIINMLCSIRASHQLSTSSPTCQLAICVAFASSWLQTY